MLGEHFDVLIVGAGLSGIGAACHLQRECPDRSYVILEGRGDLGGTWDLFRYPGVRSDSDMHTLGYDVQAVDPREVDRRRAGDPRLPAETAAENGVERHIRYRHHVDAASWSSDEARWTVRAAPTPRPATRSSITCSFLFMSAGYYSYKEPLRGRAPRHRAVRGHGRAPAVLAGRSRLPRQARRGDRFRGDGDDDRAGDGARRRARHDAAALADVRRRTTRP